MEGSSFTYGQAGRIRRMMVIIPHEDDEINLAGSVIYGARQEHIPVTCVFVTNGDFEFPAAVRLGEAAQALKVLGVQEKDIFFLGYADGGSHGERSAFLKKDTAEGAPGHRETYGVPDHADFSFSSRGRHQPYRWKNIVQDMKDVILHVKPDAILATGFDSHPDHRMCHFAFHEAMKDILRENSTYRPLVLKGFCYTTGFKSVEDFYDRHFLSTVINRAEMCQPAWETENPVYTWAVRVRVPVPAACRGNLRRNVLFQAACCHVSQKLFKRAVRLVNSDQVFWLRRTDNLAFLGHTSVSSGDGRRLSDFHRMYTRHITEKTPAMEDYLWIPAADDQGKWCRCEFTRPQHVEAVALYGNIEDGSRILKGRLSFSTGYACEVGGLERQGHETLVQVPPQDGVIWVKFEILEAQGPEAGLSEWEILERPEDPFQVLQICADGHFAYDWHIWPGEKPVISAYRRGIGGELTWFLNGKPAALQDINDRLGSLEKRAAVRVEQAGHPEVWCEASFTPAGPGYRLRHALSQAADRLFLRREKQREKRAYKKLKP